MLMIFLLVLAVATLAIFMGLKLAFLIFLGIVAVVIIAVAFLIGGFIQCGKEGDDNHGPMDKFLFGE